MKLKVPPVVVFLISGCLMVVIHYLSHDWSVGLIKIKALAFALFGAGVAIGLAGVYEFWKQKTTVDPTKPEKASSIVTSGIYQYTRNPMYLGMAVGLLGGVFYTGNFMIIGGVLFFMWYMTTFQIKPEEEILKAHFGEPYRHYLHEVRRWL